MEIIHTSKSRGVAKGRAPLSLEVRWSVAVAIAAEASDAASSWGGRELNPMLGQRFDARSAAIKGGIMAAGLVWQYYRIRNRPELYRPVAWVNFGVGLGIGGVAVHNWRMRR